MSQSEKPPALLGTVKQVAYAERIRRDWLKRHPGAPPPAITLAGWWIANEERLRGGADGDTFTGLDPLDATPFTCHLPRHSRAEAEATLALALLAERPIMVLDTETSGVGKGAEVVQLALVDGRTGRMLFHALIRPTGKQDPAQAAEAAAVHGIPCERLIRAPSLPQLWPRLLPLLARDGAALLAWNAPYDLAMLHRSAAANGLPAPALRGVCLMRLFSAYHGLPDWCKLDEAAALVGVAADTYGPAHGALRDARVTAAILAHLLDSATGKGAREYAGTRQEA